MSRQREERPVIGFDDVVVSPALAKELVTIFPAGRFRDVERRRLPREATELECKEA